MIMLDPNHSASMNEIRMEATVHPEGTCGGTAEFTLGAATIPPALQAMGLTVDQLQSELDAINRVFKRGLPQMRVQPAMVGMLIFFIGFIVSFASIIGNFAANSRRDGGGIRPDGFLIGFAISFCGMMISVVGSMWLSKRVLAAIEDVRRHLNQETNPAWAQRQLAWRIDHYTMPKRARVWFVACYSTQPIAMNVPTAMAVPGYGYGGMPPPGTFPGQYPAPGQGMQAQYPPMGAHPYPAPGQYGGPYGQPYYPGGPGMTAQPPMGMNGMPQQGQQGYPPQQAAGQQAQGVPAYYAPPNVAVRNPAATGTPAGAPSAGSGGGSGGGGQTSKQGSDALNY